MIVCDKVLYLGAEWDAATESYKCIPTGERSKVLLEGDITLYKQGEVPDYAGELCGNMDSVVISLDHVKHMVRGKLIATWVIAVVSLIALIVVSWRASLAMLNGVANWATYILVALFMVVAALYLSQAYNPVVHDARGHRINLRTGASNFHGGCRIKRDKAWRDVLASFYAAVI